MPRERESYCLLIGLNPFREDKYSATDITSKIKKKEEAWKKKAEDPQEALKRRFQFSAYAGMVPDMRSTMGSPVLRISEFEAGRKLLKAKASKLRKSAIILHDGSLYLIPGEQDNLAKRIKWDDVTGADILKVSGIVSAKMPRPVPSEIEVAYQKMSDVGLNTPAELLNTLIQMPELEIAINRLDKSCTPDQVRIAFDAVERRLNAIKAGKIPNQDAYIQAIRSLKLVLTPDEKLKMLATYGECMEAMAPAMETMDEDYGLPFTSEYLDNLLSIYANKNGADTQLSRSILEAYCCKKKYLANFSDKDSRLALCPTCKGMVAESDDSTFCPICGNPVRIVCPHCGTNQSVANKSCVRCGINLEGGLKSVRKIEDDIRRMIITGNSDGASKKLDELLEGYPSYPNNSELAKLVDRAVADLRAIRGKTMDDYKIRHFYDLKRVIEKGQKKFPSLLNDKGMAAMYKEACDKTADAERIILRAAAMTGDSAVDMYIQAADRCPDHPEIVVRLKDYPPEGPADATVQVRGDTVLVRFAVPEDRRGMTFCIYRGKDGLPDVGPSTVPLAEIPGSVFLDKTPDPGVDYYYKIYSKRWGILSREFAQYGPAMVLREVTDARLEPIEDGLRVSYVSPKGCSRVRIWRKEGSSAAGNADEIEIVHGNTGTVNDRGLKGDATYNYLFVAEYDVNGRTERSLGSVFSGKTVRYPAPVNDMEVGWNKSDGSYTARWGSKEHVVLYATPKKAKIFGSTMPMDDIEKWMTRVEPLETYDNGCRFDLPDGAVMFLYPMIPLGQTAVRGREVMIANLRPFRDVEKRMSGRDCDLTMTWPDGAESAVVMVSDSAAKADNAKSERITVSREGYEVDRKIRIPLGNSLKKTVTIYAVYGIDDKKLQSIGITLDIYSGVSNKVRYSMATENIKGQRKNVRVNINIECPDQSVVPRCVLVGVAKGIPLKMRDGEVLWDSEGAVRLAGGRATASFDLPKEKADLSRMRLFFPNREDYNLFRFVHPLYGGNY